MVAANPLKFAPARNLTLPSIFKRIEVLDFVTFLAYKVPLKGHTLKPGIELRNCVIILRNAQQQACLAVIASDTFVVNLGYGLLILLINSTRAD